MSTILLVEDDRDFGKMLKQYLELNKFQVFWALNGQEGLMEFKKREFDICIIDVMMPIMDGFTLADKIVDLNPETPFLFLTARKTSEDRIKGLKLGADDYVVKPFEAEELILRIKNIIKRARQQGNYTTDTGSGEVTIGKYKLDLDNLKITLGNTESKITEKEAKLLYYLYTNQNQLIRREELLSAVWGKTDFFSGRSMDVFISRIRKYLKDDSSLTIESVRGVGLQFNIKP